MCRGEYLSATPPRAVVVLHIFDCMPVRTNGCTMHEMLKPVGAEAVLPLLQQNQHEINGKAIEAKAAVPKTSGNGLVPANRKMFVGGTVSSRAERFGQQSCTLVPSKRTKDTPHQHQRATHKWSSLNASISADCTCRQCCSQHLQLCPSKQFVGGVVQLGLVECGIRASCRPLVSQKKNECQHAGMSLLLGWTLFLNFFCRES